ncbi:MAG: DUF3048 domain-containing protein [Candidatus Nanopelagicales bacterium]
MSASLTRAPGLLAVGGLAAALVLTGCGGSPPADGPSSSAVAATSSAPPTVATPEPEPTTPTPTTSPPGIPDGASPLSGRPKGAGQPVLVVKYDNTRSAQPHAGLVDADVVYVEEVEYGLTRLAAVFSSRLPDQVGPIRSARITDVDLLAQYGRPAFAYSGAQSKLRPVLADASFYDVSGDLGPTGYWRQSGRSAPYDFFGDPERLLARAPKAADAAPIGFVFADEAPEGGKPGTEAVVTWPAATTTFTWDKAEGAYEVSFDGSPAREASGGTQHATTVVIQYVKQTDSGYGDKFGGRTPLAHTVGEGKATVLRDGKAYGTTWSRPSEEDGTTFTRVDGTPMAFAPGQIWVLLVAQERTAALS